MSTNKTQGPSAEVLRTLEQVPNMYLILTPDLHILTASDLYLEATRTQREAIRGKYLFEAFPDNPALPEVDGVQQINASLQKVLRTKAPDHMSVQRYDVPDPENPGKFITRYWNPSHKPVLDDQGEIMYIIQLATNVSEQLAAELALVESRSEHHKTLIQMQALNDELLRSNTEIKTINCQLQNTKERLLELNEQLEQRISGRTEELANSERQLREALIKEVIAYEALAEMNERLHIAIDAGGLGYTEIDQATGNMICNVRFKNCYGRRGAEVFTYEDLYGAILPEYRDNVAWMVAHAKETRTIYKASYPVQWPDGSIHWINAHGKGRYNKLGELERMIGLITDITEQKKNETLKNDFIAMVSHELKTPLTSLSAFVQLLQCKGKDIDENFRVMALQHAYKQVGKMTNMINGFLSLASLESGKIALDLTTFDLQHLLREVEAEVQLTVHSHPIAFDLCDSMFVHADSNKLSQVLQNLINNAVKYSPPGKQIEVDCHLLDGAVQVDVKDQGAGVKPDEADKLFDRYYRVEHVQQYIAGFGIGLYLCAEIIRQHQGEIGVHSEVGKGSTFYFRLPVAAPPATP